nr:12622_t:CDS:2 [Entrophospora candida]
MTGNIQLKRIEVNQLTNLDGFATRNYVINALKTELDKNKEVENKNNCVPVSINTINKPFEFVLVNSGALNNIREDYHSFQEHFGKNNNSQVVSFLSFSGDTLIVPIPKVGEKIEENLINANGATRWLSTSGLENKKPFEIVYELKNYEVKKSSLSLSARSKVIDKSGSNYLSENREDYGPGRKNFDQLYRRMRNALRAKPTCKISGHSDSFDEGKDYAGMIVYAIDNEFS